MTFNLDQNIHPKNDKHSVFKSQKAQDTDKHQSIQPAVTDSTHLQVTDEL